MDFESLVSRTLRVDEQNAVQLNPASNNNSTNAIPSFPHFKWEKDVAEKCKNVNTGYGELFSDENIQKLYRRVGKGYVKKDDIDIENIALQDLFHELYFCPAVNAKPKRADALPWDVFRMSVDRAYTNNDSRAVSIVDLWCADKTNLESYQPRNPEISKQYELALKDKDIVNRTLIQAYDNDTILIALLKILQFRVSNINKFLTKIVNIGRTQRMPGESEVLEMLKYPNSFLQGAKKTPDSFGHIQDTRPKDIQMIGLFAKAFFKSENERFLRILSSTEQRSSVKAQEQPPKKQMTAAQMRALSQTSESKSDLVNEGIVENFKKWRESNRQKILELEQMSGAELANYVEFLRNGVYMVEYQDEGARTTSRTDALPGIQKYTLKYINSIKTAEAENLLKAIRYLCEYTNSAQETKTGEILSSLSSNIMRATGAKLYG